MRPATSPSETEPTKQGTAENELGQRRPVWEALSELFLDADPAPSRAARAAVLAASPFDAAELEAILLDEVQPVCQANLESVAGEWSGFDPRALEAAIRARPRRPAGWLARLRPARRALQRSAEWRATLDAVAALRRLQAD